MAANVAGLDKCATHSTLTATQPFGHLSKHKDLVTTEHSLVYQLKTDLGYSDADTEAAIAVAWDFGLIEPYEVLREHVDRLRITPKGEFIMRLPFENPAITYFMATTGRLSKATLSDSKTFELHDPRRGAARRFVPSAIKTGLTLLRHVRSAHALEMGTASLTEERRLTYALPAMDVWLRRAVGYGAAYSRNNPIGYRELVNDLQGIPLVPIL